MKAGRISRRFRNQMIVILCTGLLFVLILILSALTTPEEIPSLYYADNGTFRYENTSIPARVLLFLILLFFGELVLFFRKELAGILSGIRKSGRAILFTILLLAVSGAAGACLAYLGSSLMGETCKEFWIILAAVSTMLAVFQLRLLFRKDQKIFPEGFRDKKLAVYWAVLIVFVLLILFVWYDRGHYCPPGVQGVWRYAFPFVLIIGEMVIAALLYQKYCLYADREQIPYQRLFLIIVFFLAVAYMLVFLPFVSPDENLHYLSAYRLSDLFLAKTGRFGDARLIMRLEDSQFHMEAQLINSPNYFAQIIDQTHFFLQERGFVVIESTMASNAVFGYFPAAAGMALARILGLSSTMLFYMGRLFNILFCTAVYACVMKKTGMNRTALFTFLSLPMMLHLMASCSYDAAIVCFAALFISQIMKIFSEEKEVSGRDYYLLILYGALLAPSKLVYTPLLLLVFMIPADRFSAMAKTALAKKVLVIAAGFLMILLTTRGITWMAPTSAVQEIASEPVSGHWLSWCGEEGYTISILAGQIPKFLIMCIRTVIRKGAGYFLNMIGNRFGWLNIGIPIVYTMISFVLLLLGIFFREGKDRPTVLSGGKKAWTVLLCLACTFAVFVAMMLGWTPLSYDIVAGIQGRYFLPLLITAIWVLPGRHVLVNNKVREILVPAVVLINVWILVYVYSHTIFSL